tara:strand:+ start:3716 stop:4060 length:345 start_codon:yes stop_codon:yes gene_type:complete
LVSNKICRKLRKYKERINNSSHKNRTQYKDSTFENDSNLLIETPDFLKEGLKGNLPEPFIKNKYFEMKPISISEARKQLDFIDHAFYFFRNNTNNQLQVIYKRNHGGYGLIQSK